ncbi:hypothetical protein EOA25_04060, partial [Mesorhizobium sp. M2A.F.Ca.ET.040.01.1.1]
LDKFFWLKAVKDQDGNMRLLHGSDQARPAAKEAVYRLANIVLQGGGVLGLAHAGFVAGLEMANVRFAGIAGASAGAIMAMGMTAVRGENLLDPTHEELVKIVGAMPMSTFIDGPFRTRRLIKQFLLGRVSLRPSALPAWLGALGRILRKRGLNPGNAFEDWLRGVLAERGIRSVQDLFDRLRSIARDLNEAKVSHLDSPLFKSWDLGKGDELGEGLLQIMAACMPVGVKFQFPRDIKHLSAETRANSPAALVRASMSIPLFFEPAIFDVNKRLWPKFVADHLKELASKSKQDEFAKVDQVAFLDGGIFSNLPVDAFREIMPNVPTIAVPLMSTTLARPYQRRARLQSLAADIGTVAFMIRNQRDRDAIDQLRQASHRFEERSDKLTPSHPFRLANIDVGEVNWLNFVMDETDMMDLFLVGLRRAKGFIENEMQGET